MIEENFRQAYLRRSWASGGVLSGSGSRLDRCADLLEWLEGLIREEMVASILDLGCGDLNWVSEVTGLKRVKYFGIDVVPTLVDHHKRVFPWFAGRCADVETVFDVSADVVMCKDVFMHLCNGKNEQILQNVKAGQWKYFLCTNFPGARNAHRRGLNSARFAEYDVLPLMEGETIARRLAKPCGGEYLIFSR